jgi:hypothetical protein
MDCTGTRGGAKDIPCTGTVFEMVRKKFTGTVPGIAVILSALLSAGGSIAGIAPFPLLSRRQTGLPATVIRPATLIHSNIANRAAFLMKKRRLCYNVYKGTHLENVYLYEGHITV